MPETDPKKPSAFDALMLTLPKRVPEPVTEISIPTPKGEPFKTTLKEAKVREAPTGTRPQVIKKQGLTETDPWLTYHHLVPSTPAQMEKAKQTLGVKPAQYKVSGLAGPAQPPGIAGPSAAGGTTGGATGSTGTTGGTTAGASGGTLTYRDPYAGIVDKIQGTQKAAQDEQRKQNGGAIQGDPFPNATWVKFGGGLNMGRKEQKGAAVRPGAGVWALGFNPKDPNFEAKVTSWLAKHRNAAGVYVDDKGRPINWMNGENKGFWGKQNVPSFKKLKEMYPDKSDGVLLDAAFRGAFSESSIPATNFLEQMIDPIVEVVLNTIGNAIAPGWGTAASIGYGGIKGGVEGGVPGALLGGLGGYSAGASPGATLASSAAGAINPDLGTALSLASGGYKGLTGGGWKDFAGSAAGKAAGAVTDNPYIRFMAGLAGKGLAPGPTKGP